MAPKKTKAEPKPLSPEVLAALEGSKSASRDALRSQMVFSAWPIDKHPGLRKTLIPASGTIKKRKISVPRGYRSKEYDVIDVRVGEELNLVVFKYYSGLLTLEVTEEAKKRDQNRRGRIKQSGSTEMDGWIDGGGWGINYVAGEGIMQKRNEYLGPAPKVAGYLNLKNTAENIRILWTDAFLDDRWCEAESWDAELEIVVNAKGDAEWAIAQS